MFILQQCLNPNPYPNPNFFFGFGFGSSQNIQIISDSDPQHWDPGYGMRKCLDPGSEMRKCLDPRYNIPVPDPKDCLLVHHCLQWEAIGKLLIQIPVLKRSLNLLREPAVPSRSMHTGT
jgi:hypothetical protein